MKTMWMAALLAAVWVGGATAAPVDVQPFVKRDVFEQMKLSPGGEYLAATVPQGDRTGVVVLRRSDMKVTASYGLGRFNHAADVIWVNGERLVITVAQRFGMLDQPLLTGEIFAMNWDGSKRENLVGYRVESKGAGTRIQPKKVEDVAAFVVDTLRDDDRNIIISVRGFENDAYARAEKMDVYSGRRTQIGRAPVRRTEYFTDSRGVVRMATGQESDNFMKLYHRPADGGEWTLVNDEQATGRIETPIRFSPDDSIAYLRSRGPGGPDAIVAWTVATGERREVLRDKVVDPTLIALDDVAGLVGAMFEDGKPRFQFLDPESERARINAMLQDAFGGDVAVMTSITRDGNLALVRTYSDRNPGDFFLFDVKSRQASHLASRAEWIDPERMATTKPVVLKARDGLELHGLLTLPKAGGRHLPLVVNPHGGPYGIHDAWDYDGETQMLAAAGYAVLKVNFRGSGNRGRAFQAAGAREWGGTMQDDLTDATRWAIQEGIADRNRICIYGASYGGYASLMGVAKEPDLYRCAVGYIGVYDLPMMQKEDGRSGGSLRTWTKEWVGDDLAKLAANSPNRIADRITVPVFLAAGGEDFIAPIEHSKMMERALIRAGVPVETLYYPNEGHGFYQEKNRAEFYTKLIAFLDRHIGGKPAAATAPETDAQVANAD